MNPKIQATETSTGHLKVQEVRAHPSHLQSQRDFHHKGGRQNLKIHHHPAAQAATVSPLMKRRMPAEEVQGPLFNPRRNTNLNPHRKGVPSPHLDPLLRVNPDPDLQAGMAKPGVTVDQEAVPTHRKGLCLEEDQHLIPGGLGDHIHPTGDHLVEGEDLHLILHAGSLDQDRGLRAEVGTPIDLRVISLLEDLHPNIIENLIHQIINVISVHTHLTPGEDIT